jgi:broad specificity phosphatase PhoE
MQTLLLAKRLSKVKFKEIYASDAKRCLKSANEIFQTLENKNDIKIIDSPLLKEKNYGNLEGKNLEEVKIIVPVC